MPDCTSRFNAAVDGFDEFPLRNFPCRDEDGDAAAIPSLVSLPPLSPLDQDMDNDGTVRPLIWTTMLGVVFDESEDDDDDEEGKLNMDVNFLRRLLGKDTIKSEHATIGPSRTSFGLVRVLFPPCRIPVDSRSICGGVTKITSIATPTIEPCGLSLGKTFKLGTESSSFVSISIAVSGSTVDAVDSIPIEDAPSILQ
eukprot:scaffold112967_cov48-Attheya_sp.AAC.1